MPDAKTLAPIGKAIAVEFAQEKGVVQSRRMRVGTTVVETHIHYPTGSSLLGDGARVFTRTMKKLPRLTRQILNDTQPVVVEVGTLSKNKKGKLQPLMAALTEMGQRVRQAIG